METAGPGSLPPPDTGPRYYGAPGPAPSCHDDRSPTSGRALTRSVAIIRPPTGRVRHFRLPHGNLFLYT